jgi:predicted amidohydrolase
MHSDFDRNHEALYSGATFSLGIVQWYLLRAKNLIDDASKKPPIQGEFCFRRVSETLTDFGNKFYGKEIYWWIYQQEQDHDLFLKRTEKTYESAQKLERNAESLISYDVESCEDAINRIKQFCEENNSEIQQLLEYTEWLGKKDPRAPIILFSFQGGWSASELSERSFSVEPNINSPDLQKSQETCTEFALGLRNILKFQTSKREIITDFFTFIKNIRDSLRIIINETDNFAREPHVIRTIHISPTTKNIVRFGLVQLNYSLHLMRGKFGYEPRNSKSIKEKILSAIQIAKENQVDVLTFPELCFKKEWIAEILPLSEDLIIIGGSYYDNASNICPIMINGCLIQPEYKKVNPSSSEKIEIENERMISGKFIYFYETSIGIFSVLTCIDFEQVIYSIISDKQKKIDFIINPCYDEQIERFQKLADSICENNEITIIQTNRSEDRSRKYGRSGILGREHDSIITRLTTAKMRTRNDPKYLLAKAKGEELLIADINFEIKSPPRPLPGDYPGRIDKVRKIPL